MIPGAEVVGTTPDGKRVVALVGGGGYAERVLAAPAFMYEVPDGVDDGAGAGDHPPGRHGLAPAAHVRPPEGR